MKNTNNYFQAASYLQYPAMLIGLYFAIEPYFNGFDYMAKNPNLLFESYNAVLTWTGIGISFSTLQDTKKLQNKLSRKVWENPKRGKLFLGLMVFSTIIIFSFGIFSYFISSNEAVKKMAYGSLILAVSLVGFLKLAMEVFENHRLDKNP